jgi:hypothetical protein
MSLESKEATLQAVDSAMDEAWALDSLEKLRNVAKRKQWVTIDDLWGVIDSPTGDRAKVGAIMRRASSKNIDKNPHGRFLKPTPYRVFSEKGNHDNIMLWESIGFLGGDESMPEIATLHADPSLDLTTLVKVYNLAKVWYDSGWDINCQLDLTEFLSESFEG